MGKYQNMCEEILSCIGGKDNIKNVHHCATRLRFTLYSPDQVAGDKDMLHIDGVLGVYKNQNTYQIIVGPKVGEIYSELIQTGNITQNGGGMKQIQKAQNDKSIFVKIIDYISGAFMPTLPILIAGGLINAILTVAVLFFGLSPQSGTYTILSSVFNASMFYLPVFVGYHAAKERGILPILGAMLGGVLVSSSINGVSGLDFLGIPVAQVSYNGSIIPVLLCVLFMAPVYKFFSKYIPKEISFFTVPLLTALIAIPISLIAIGPAADWISKYIADALLFLNKKISWLSVAILGALVPLLGVTGLQTGLFPIIFLSFETFGYEAFGMPAYLAGNFAVGGATFALLVRSSDEDTKATSLSTGLTAIFGITEPAIFGALLRFKKPFIGAISGGFVGGMFLGMMQVKEFAFGSPGIATLINFINPNGGSSNLIFAVIGAALSFFMAFLVNLLVIKEKKN